MRLHTKIASVIAGAGAVVFGIGVIPASASFTDSNGYTCRNWVTAGGATFSPCVLPSAAIAPTVQGALDSLAVNSGMDWWASLWRVNSDGSATFVTSQEIGHLSSTHQREFYFFNHPCSTYVVGVGYWLNGAWYGTWQSPRWNNCTAA